MGSIPGGGEARKEKRAGNAVPSSWSANSARLPFGGENESKGQAGASGWPPGPARRFGNAAGGATFPPREHPSAAQMICL